MPFPAAVCCKVPFYPSILFRDLYFLPTSVEKFSLCRVKLYVWVCSTFILQEVSTILTICLEGKRESEGTSFAGAFRCNLSWFFCEWTIPDIWLHQKENHLWCRCSNIRQILHPFTAKGGQVVRLGGFVWRLKDDIFLLFWGGICSSLCTRQFFYTLTLLCDCSCYCEYYHTLVQ